VKRWPLALLAVVVLLLGLLVWREIREQPIPVTVAPRPPPSAPISELPEPPVIESPIDAAIAEAHTTEELVVPHLFDSCLAPLEPSVPADDETLVARGITVAWPNDINPEWPFHPAVIAGAVRGILDEAAELTGTVPRDKLTVIVYATQDAYVAHTHGPAWSGGLYDGAEIHVPASARADLAVEMRTLRHELMHAQLHVGVGCMPAWFNEGLAMYFAGQTQMHDLVALFRESGPLEAEVNAATYDHLDAAHASRAYAESLARVMFIAARTDGEQALRDLCAAIRAASARGRASAWDTLFPHVDQRKVLDAVSRKIFDAPFGTDVDTLVRGPMCCTGTTAPRVLSCRATQASTERVWIDKTTHALCRNLW
jgi:hypothetical protein